MPAIGGEPVALAAGPGDGRAQKRPVAPARLSARQQGAAAPRSPFTRCGALAMPPAAEDQAAARTASALIGGITDELPGADRRRRHGRGHPARPRRGQARLRPGAGTSRTWPRMTGASQQRSGLIWPRASGSPTAARPTSSGTRSRSTARSSAARPAARTAIRTTRSRSSGPARPRSRCSRAPPPDAPTDGSRCQTGRTAATSGWPRPQ